MSLATYISLDDLYVAYRKAKADAFFERDHPTGLEFSEYEASLDDRLKTLHTRLTAADPTWRNDASIVGSFAFIPKNLELGATDTSFIDSEADLPAAEQKPKSEFRLVGVHGVDFHVISSLWLMKVGHYFDSTLKSCAYGSRMRRVTPSEAPPDVSVGNFHGYTRGFKMWRSGGISAMHEGLKNKRRVVAITADLRRFYHEIDPGFLVNPLYLTRHSSTFTLNADELTFTELLVDALKFWAAKSPGGPIGIPVGLPVSRLIANVLLEEFDSFVEEQLAPLYYGRYVDDVFLVLGGLPKQSSSESVWNSLCAKSKGLLVADKDPVDGELAYWLHLPYGGASRLRFAGQKQKVFSLKGTKGIVLLKAITSTISETSSDWRLLPDLEEDEDAKLTDVVAASSDAAEEADNLRKSDGLTVRRLAFAIRLRNFETVERHLPPAKWRKFRLAFLRLAIDNIVTVPGLFSYYPYIPRLLGLAVACRDFEWALELTEKIGRVLAQVSSSTDHNPFELALCSRRLYQSCYQSVCMALAPGSASNPELDSLAKRIGAGISSMENVQIDQLLIFTTSGETAVKQGSALFFSDLSRIPWRELFLESGRLNVLVADGTPMVSPSVEVAIRLYVQDLREFLSQVHTFSQGDQITAAPRPALYPTRPFALAEITRLSSQWLKFPEKLQSWLRAVRGVFVPSNALSRLPSLHEGVLRVPKPRSEGREPLVAVPCFLTKDDSWVASVSGAADPDVGRFFRLNRVVNHVLEGSVRPDYFVLPECSLPRSWFDWFALRLAESGISLVAGVEYRHWADTSGKYVSNEVRMSLVTDFLGYPDHLTCVQEKSRPAFHEEQLLFQVAGLVLKPVSKERFIVDHGGFRFSTLICSELTDISARAALRGQVDALFVPEWNSDLDSFSPLVEASASDIHCYVVQANNRLFGDCRIRAPFKTSHMRDIARIRGGEADYFIVGRLNVSALRAFQSGHRSPANGPFKPVPDGFSIAPERKCMPST